MNLFLIRSALPALPALLSAVEKPGNRGAGAEAAERHLRMLNPQPFQSAFLSVLSAMIKAGGWAPPPMKGKKLTETSGDDREGGRATE